jgi:hypothetical protein
VLHILEPDGGSSTCCETCVWIRPFIFIGSSTGIFCLSGGSVSRQLQQHSPALAPVALK